MTMETGTDELLLMPSISNTRMACPAGMWSMTVPFRMAVTRRMLCSWTSDITSNLCWDLNIQESAEQGHPGNDAVEGLFKVPSMAGFVDRG